MFLCSYRDKTGRSNNTCASTVTRDERKFISLSLSVANNFALVQRVSFQKHFAKLKLFTAMPEKLSSKSCGPLLNIHWSFTWNQNTLCNAVSCTFVQLIWNSFSPHCKYFSPKKYIYRDSIIECAEYGFVFCMIYIEQTQMHLWPKNVELCNRKRTGGAKFRIHCNGGPFTSSLHKKT